MNTKIIFITCLLLINTNFALGQTIQSFMRPMGSLADVKKGIFSSIEAGFSIALPKQTGGFNGTKGIQYDWRLTEGYFFVGIEDREIDIENTDNFESETGKVVDRIVNDIARDLFATKFEVKNAEKKFTQFQAHKQMEIRANLTDTVILLRVFWVKNRAYKLAVLLTEAQKKFEPQAQTVFDSLRISSKDDTDDIIRRKIETNTPKPLPQTPVVPKAKSDAEDENLKGNVKTVFQESQFIKGQKAGSPKQKDSDDYYNGLGNFTKRVFYDDTSGFPYEIMVYGYINQSRVSKNGYILYGNELSGISLSAPPSAVKKIDSRYSDKYQYKYDSAKNLIEKIIYGNEGAIWTKTVYVSKDNIIEQILYDRNGKLNSRNIAKIDEKGNEIENTDFDSPVAGENAIYVYKYAEFDKEGNWTKRTMTKSRSFRGTTREEWTMVEYRAISYYL